MNVAKRPDGRWRARYRDAEGVEHARHFARKGRGAAVAGRGNGRDRDGNLCRPEGRTANRARVRRRVAILSGRPGDHGTTHVKTMLRLRQGEAFGLTVDRVSFLRRALTVDRQLVLLPGREPYLAPPKTVASVRTVPLPSVVVDGLAAHLAEYPPRGDGFVFTTERGRPLRRTSFSAQAWQPAVAAAGLPAGTHFHDLRHFYASLLIRHGESVKVVQARLGHASAAETLDTYSHLWPDSDDRTREAVDAVLGTAAVPLSLAGPV